MAIGALAVLAGFYAWHSYAAAPPRAGSSESLVAELRLIEAKYKALDDDSPGKPTGLERSWKRKGTESSWLWEKYIKEVRECYRKHGEPIPMFVPER